MVFRIRRELEQRAIHKITDRVSLQSERKTTQFQGIFVWVAIFHF